ncbi:hypothetical protein AAW01_04475 [Aurantiacibacter gangjinensis]|uniref:Methyltransferase n=1 Tax=Aurantiacibacter gangjinensis TaxID=502682 RepID=A0A0G9MSL4_9SPHN|nr:hypothetical protein AAW01_04475 [Aurantiacibacter gangjinensis]
MESPLGQIFCSGDGRPVDKWVHYIPIYERYLEHLRGSSFKMLEIGVFQGGSLDMWRSYFGDECTLFGVDIDSKTVDRVSPPNQVRIGSQDDPAFLADVVREMGGLDLVLDDGSHVGKHQWSTFETLFPLLSEGGLYIIEDTHTSYWWQYGGGQMRRRTANNLAKQIIDDMHAWYHKRKQITAAKTQIDAMHIHDSIIVIEKRTRGKPRRVLIETR